MITSSFETLYFLNSCHIFDELSHSKDTMVSFKYVNFWPKPLKFYNQNDINTHCTSFTNNSLYLIAAWHDDFTVSVEETMIYPIEKVPFPTVTLCPQNTNPERWGSVIKIFDHMQRKCSENG